MNSLSVSNFLWIKTSLKRTAFIALCAMLLSVRVGNANAVTVNISLTPNDALSDLFLVYVQPYGHGDMMNIFHLADHVSAVATTSFSVSFFDPMAPGTPLIGLVANYMPGHVYVGLDPTAASMIMSGKGTPFSAAFGNYTMNGGSAITPTEADLSASLRSVGSGGDILGSPYLEWFGFQTADQLPRMFAVPTGGTTEMTLVKFSDAEFGGTAQIEYLVESVPDAAGSMWLLGCGLLALRFVPRPRKAIH